MRLYWGYIRIMEKKMETTIVYFDTRLAADVLHVRIYQIHYCFHQHHISARSSLTFTLG